MPNTFPEAVREIRRMHDLSQRGLQVICREKRALRVEVRGLRLALSACQKRSNRLVARCKTLDRACKKHRAQATNDQQYIARLEAIIEGLGGSERMVALRDEMRA